MTVLGIADSFLQHINELPPLKPHLTSWLALISFDFSFSSAHEHNLLKHLKVSFATKRLLSSSYYYLIATHKVQNYWLNEVSEMCSYHNNNLMKNFTCQFRKFQEFGRNSYNFALFEKQHVIRDGRKWFSGNLKPYLATLQKMKPKQ